MIEKTEIWKDVIGYEDYYTISTFGNIRSYHSNKGWIPGTNIKPYYWEKGYVTVTLNNKICYKTFRIHILVAKVFLGEAPKGIEVNHIDGNKHNNRLDNLEYKTKKENMEHAAKNGLTARGEKQGNSKLTEQEVIEIRYFYNLGASKEELVREYDLSRTHIYGILNRRLWSWL